MFCYHPTFKFIQMHKKLSGKPQKIKSDQLIVKTFLDAIEDGSDLYRLRTEDGVEVRKLYIKLLDSSTTSEEVKFLLSVYGEIDVIKIFGKGEKCGWKMKNRGFVTFSKACDASFALINRKKFSEIFVLSPADTWHQPGYAETQIYADHTTMPAGTDSKFFETLNDDCLLHMMKFLDVLYVVTLMKVCRKFAELGAIHIKTVKNLNFTNIKFKKKITLHEAKLVLETVGHNVTKASINSDKFHNRRILNFVPKYLTNVKHLHLTGFKLEAPFFWDEMEKLLAMLETLDLSDNSEVHVHFLRSFKKSPSRLKHLNVSNCNINGDFLMLIPTLQILNISGCRFITGQHLIKFVDLNKDLKSLNISKCPNIFGKDVNEMLKKVPQLEVLSLNNYYIDDETSRFVIPSINPLINLKQLTIQNINYPPCDQLLRTINLDNRIEVLSISYGNLTLTSVYAISTMKHLKKLIMNFKNSVPEDLVDYLVDLENLEEVHMSGCSYISPANILRLILLPRLKFLDISRCYGFTNEFVIEALELLKETHSTKTFMMHVGRTEIDHAVLKDSEFKKFHNRFLLKWEATKDIEHDYDIDEENKYQVNKVENPNQQEHFTIDGKRLISGAFKYCLSQIRKA